MTVDNTKYNDKSTFRNEKLVIINNERHKFLLLYTQKNKSVKNFSQKKLRIKIKNNRKNTVIV